MRRDVQAFLLACMTAALVPVNAEEITSCFTLQFDWRTQMDDSYEEHQVEADFRPSRYGDQSGVYQPSEKQDCDIAGLEPGQVRKFRLAWMRGSAKGVNPPFTATARVDGPPPAGDDTSVTVTRKREGAAVEFAVEAVPGKGESEFGLCHPSWKPTAFLLTEQELRDFANLRKTLKVSLEEDACSGNGVVVLSAAAREEIEVTVEVAPEYERWLPKGNLDSIDEPGARLALKVLVHKKGEPKTPRKARIDFTFVDVSMEKGMAANWPAKGAAPDYDLRFLKKENPDLEVVRPDHARSKEPVSELRAVISSHDFGAWGTLHVKATDAGGKDVRVRIGARDTNDLVIPLDDNDNRIADGWEMNALGHLRGSRDLDDEKAPQQDTEGDGITLFNEYRGVVVLENGRQVHKRLDPRVKELFVIDPADIVPSALWKRVSHMQVVRVDESLVDPEANEPNSPLVNFNASDGSSHPFYAIRIRKVDGDYDADAPAGDPKTTTNPLVPSMAYILKEPDGIKGTEYVKVFPDRVQILVTRRMKWIEDGLADPSSEAGMTLRDPANGFTTDDAAAALGVLKTTEGRKSVVRRILNTVLIHELGHSCGNLPDHAPPDERPYTAVDEASRQCLMNKPETVDYRRMIVFTALGRADPDLASGYTGFCNLGEKYQCARMLSTKNW
jgi:hypothetical protein